MEAVLYPQSESKYGTTRENTWRYYTPKRQISYLLSKYCCRFYALLLRREKQIKQRSGLRQVLRDARVGLAHSSTCHIMFQNDSKLNFIFDLCSQIVHI